MHCQAGQPTPGDPSVHSKPLPVHSHHVLPCSLVVHKVETHVHVGRHIRLPNAAPQGNRGLGKPLLSICLDLQQRVMIQQPRQPATHVGELRLS